jgi:NAD(P)-dependent dehydrogenase (short-subunit alcohol dehydrogenase family)
MDALKAQFPSVDYIPLKLDLSIQQSVRTAAAEVLSWSRVPTIDIVVNSAGVMNIPERTFSQEGIEIHFATNHIGHFLFSCLIMPKLLKSADGNPKGTTRLINVTSASPQRACMRWSDLNFERRNRDLPEEEQPPYGVHRAWGTTDPENKTYLPLEGYNQSKVANVLFSIAANKRLYEKHGILSLAVHPGVIRTELSRNNSPETMQTIQGMLDKGVYHLKTTGAGAATSLVAALDHHLGVGGTRDGKENYGVYLVDCQISDKATPRAVSSDEAEKLWKLSEDLVNEKFTW